MGQARIDYSSNSLHSIYCLFHPHTSVLADEDLHGHNVYLCDCFAKIIYPFPIVMSVERERKGHFAADRNECTVLTKAAGVTKLDCIRNEEIRYRLQQRLIMEVERERQERIGWWKVTDWEVRRFGEKVVTGEVEGRRPNGRTRKRWRDAF